MNSLLTTNILLCVITGAIVAVTVTLIILLAYIITISRKIKNIVSEFEGDVARARSVIGAIGEKISKVIFGKKK